MVIDFEALIFAWEDESQDNIYYLDLETGIVEQVNPGLADLDDLRQQIERNRERYLYIPKPDRKNTRQDLDCYLEAMANQALKRLLLVAKESPDPLFVINAILGKSPDDLSNWKNFRQARQRARIEEWLKANFVS